MRNIITLFFLLIVVNIKTFAQIPNADFENWTNLRLDDWKTNSCPLCKPPYDPYVVKMDSNANHGKYDVNLIYNGVYRAWATTKFPLPIHPKSMNAYVKHILAPCGNDTVSIKIGLMNKGIQVDSGIWIGTSTEQDFYQINIPLTNNSTLIDSAIVTLMGGNRSESCGENPPVRTNFFVDNLSLSFATASSDHGFTEQGLEIYPNPSNGIFNFNLNGTVLNHPLITIINPIGKIVYTDQINVSDTQVKINLSSQPAGIYLLVIKSDGKTSFEKIVIAKEF